MMTTEDGLQQSGEGLTPLVRQLASQLRASRSGSAVAKTFPRREHAARPGLKPALDTISSVADQRRSDRETIAALERLAGEQAARITALSAELDASEARVRAAMDQARGERARADDLERRSTELLERTQQLLTEASERLFDAENRAETSSTDLQHLTTFIQERLAARH